MSRVSGDFSVQLATRLPDWSASGLLRCIVLPVCPCVVSFSNYVPDTHDLLWTSRQHPRSILIRQVRHARFPRDMLATSSLGCYTSMLRGNCYVEFQLYALRSVLITHPTRLTSSQLTSSSQPRPTGSLHSARPGLPWLRPVTAPHPVQMN